MHGRNGDVVEPVKPLITQIEEIEIPYLPPKVDLSDLHPNGKLLTDEQIAAVQEALESCKDQRFSKRSTELKALNLPYGIIKQEGEYYAVYKGAKHGKALGEGGFGKVKLVQNLETGQWLADKIQTEEAPKDVIKRNQLEKKQRSPAEEKRYQELTQRLKELEEKEDATDKLERIELGKKQRTPEEEKRYQELTTRLKELQDKEDAADKLERIELGKKKRSPQEEKRYQELKKDKNKRHDVAMSEARITKSLGIARGSNLTRKKTPDSPSKHNLLMELIPGRSLFNFLVAHENAAHDFPSRRWCDIAIMMLEEVEKLHRKGFVHRDVKLDNFVYDPVNHQVKLIDHGLTRAMDKGEYKTQSIAGTTSYMAPEIRYAKDGESLSYSERTDVYALGIAIKQLLGIHSYHERKDKWNETDFNDDILIQNFLGDMTETTPNKRPTLAKAIEFFKDQRQHLIPVSQEAVGILDVSEYQDKLPQEKSHFITALKCVDEIVLIDSKETRDKDAYIKTVRELESAGITVRRVVISGSNRTDLINHVSDLLAAQDPSKVCRFHFFSNDNPEEACRYTAAQPIKADQGKSKFYFEEMRKHSSSVTEKHRTQLLVILEEDRDRLKRKYKTKLSNPNNKKGKIVRERIEALELEITELRDPKKRIAYEAFFEKIKALEQKMKTTGFFAKSDSQKIIADFGEDVLEEVQTFRR